MKSYLLIFIFSISLFRVIAQTPDWIWAMSAQSSVSGGAEGISVATDALDNVYVSGFYIDTITFGPFALSAMGNENAYLTKYDSNGKVKWAKSSKGISNLSGANGYGVCTDPSGNCYLTGSCGDGVSFDSDTLNGSIFLVKYDSSGNVLWAKTNSGGVAQGYAVAADAFGNVFITGSFGAPYLTLGSYTLTCAGTDDIFIAKYDSSGNLLWAKSAGGTSRDAALGITTDAAGNACITGKFGSATISFGSYTLTNADIWHNDFFIAKYDSVGTVLWATGVGGTDMEEGTSVTTDKLKNIYVTGSFYSSSVSFGAYTLNHAGGKYLFLVKYDPSGNVVWAKSIGGSGNPNGPWIASDKYSKIYVIGNYGGAVTIDTITLQSNNTMYVAGFDTSGHVLFANALNPPGDDWDAIAVGPSGCVYIGGDFAVKLFIVGNDTLLKVPPASEENVFVAKLCYSSIVPPIADFQSNDSTICENDCINFTDLSSNATSWYWSFPGGMPSSSTDENPQNICYLNSGQYNVMLIASNSGGSDSLTFNNNIAVSPAPPTPVITQVHDTLLYCSTNPVYSFYQWYDSTTLIPGATDTILRITHSGNYNVHVTNENGCSIAVGINVIIIPTGTEQYFSNDVIFLFPNPTSNRLNVMLNKNIKEGIVNIYNVLGENIYRQAFNGNTFYISLGEAGSVVFTSGIYLVQVTDEKDRWISKFVKE